MAAAAAAMAASRNRVPSGPPPGVMSGPLPPHPASRAASVAAATLSMLPNTPTPGLLPTAPSPSLLPQNPTTLIPFPTSRANLHPPGNLVPQPRITVPSTMGLPPSALPNYSSKILMPSVPHHNQHLMPLASAALRKQSAASRRRNASNDE